MPKPVDPGLEVAEKLKVEGNALFSKSKYGAAVEKYTEAITMAGHRMPVLFVNRAMAYKKREDWEHVMEDASTALSFDKGNMKANYLAGLAHSHHHDYDLAIRHLNKALEAAREANSSIKDDIWHELAKAKYAQWQQERGRKRQMLDRFRSASVAAAAAVRPSPSCESIESSAGIRQPQHDQDFQNRSSGRDCQAETTKQAEELPTGVGWFRRLTSGFDFSSSTPNAQAGSSPPASDNESAIVNRLSGQGVGKPCIVMVSDSAASAKTDEKVQQDADVWTWATDILEDLDKPTEVPSVFTCPLTMEVFRDPAITKYGQSYEKSVLLEHLKQNKWDPITRGALTEAEVYPNLGLRQAVQNYLDEHPWAWGECV
ncbi:hypothetical protein CEUSTIGMA_g10116.t1 [Chlamydomonas eustigma]|uniref:RING-type E3 ubiquitin transferase n=1 Tax=Chlamydomonas eustigma TaxID=1157962 RepID=A0A250XIR6_9CHLO|nr:hypothetical protein CEUSTIGMA_g10116.t1 [Chlamydomonas eustigma]|eukprot:GAX82690.1 hypothetical protein CEUSTIGMA_g10116.t1 [Chlamydomonas eustigma]